MLKTKTEVLKKYCLRIFKLIKNKFNQAKCVGCGSWHWALRLTDKYEIEEIKCCKCGRLKDPKQLMVLKE